MYWKRVSRPDDEVAFAFTIPHGHCPTLLGEAQMLLFPFCRQLRRADTQFPYRQTKTPFVVEIFSRATALSKHPAQEPTCQRSISPALSAELHYQTGSSDRDRTTLFLRRLSSNRAPRAPFLRHHCSAASLTSNTILHDPKTILSQPSTMSLPHNSANQVEDAHFETMAEQAFDYKRDSRASRLLQDLLAAVVRNKVCRVSGLYFIEGASERTHAGLISEEASISEEEIANFVRYGHRDLYERLGGMSRKSSDLGTGTYSKDWKEASDSPVDDPERGRLGGFASGDVLFWANTNGKVPGKQGKASANLAEEAEDMDVDCPNEADTDLPLQAQGQLSLRKHVSRPTIATLTRASQ